MHVLYQSTRPHTALAVALRSHTAPLAQDFYVARNEQKRKKGMYSCFNNLSLLIHLQLYTCLGSILFSQTSPCFPGLLRFHTRPSVSMLLSQTHPLMLAFTPSRTHFMSVFSQVLDFPTVPFGEMGLRGIDGNRQRLLVIASNRMNRFVSIKTKKSCDLRNSIKVNSNRILSICI